MEKKPTYEAPKLIVIGEVKDLTLANEDGWSLDIDEPAGTPRGDLTFS